MAVTNLKYQLEFRQGAEGWSEVYYRAGTDPKAAFPNAQALVVERKKLLSAVAVIHHVRISAAQPGGRAFRYSVSSGAGALAPSAHRDVRNVTLTVQAWGQTVGSRVFKFHGCPDDMHHFDAAGNPSTAIPGVVSTFMDYLIDQSFQIRTVALPANDPDLPKVTDITVAAGAVKFFGAFPGTVIGEKVRIGSCKGYKCSQFNGVWAVSDVGAGPPAFIECQTTRLLDGSFLYVKGTGRLREANAGDYTFVNLDDYSSNVFFSTRKVGRPTDSPVGRR